MTSVYTVPSSTGVQTEGEPRNKTNEDINDDKQNNRDGRNNDEIDPARPSNGESTTDREYRGQ